MLELEEDDYYIWLSRLGRDPVHVDSYFGQQRWIILYRGLWHLANISLESGFLILMISALLTPSIYTTGLPVGTVDIQVFSQIFAYAVFAIYTTHIFMVYKTLTKVDAVERFGTFPAVNYSHYTHDLAL